jgi:hypothetical protein
MKPLVRQSNCQLSKDSVLSDWIHTEIFAEVWCISCVHKPFGERGGAVVEALRYKPEGRGIDSRWCLRNFSLT